MTEPVLCPTCNQPMPDGDHTVIDLGDRKTLVIRGSYVRLTPNQKQLFLSLWRRRPRYVRHGTIMDDLYGLEPEEAWPDQKIIDVYVCKLRRALKDTPIDVETSWGEGFRVVLKEDAPA